MQIQPGSPSGAAAPSSSERSRQSDGFSGPAPTGLDALSRVIAAYGPDRLSGRGHARASDRALRDAVRQLTREARARDSVRAERLIIELRESWPHLPGLVRSGVGARRALWDRVVTLCCKEFYRGDDEPA